MNYLILLISVMKFVRRIIKKYIYHISLGSSFLTFLAIFNKPIKQIYDQSFNENYFAGLNKY